MQKNDNNKLVRYSQRQFVNIDTAIDALTSIYIENASLMYFDPEDDGADPIYVDPNGLDEFLTYHLEVESEDDPTLRSLKTSAIAAKCYEFNRILLELRHSVESQTSTADCLNVIQVDIPDVVNSIDTRFADFTGLVLVGVRGAVSTGNGDNKDILYPSMFWHGRVISLPFVCDLDEQWQNNTVGIAPPNNVVHKGTTTIH